MKLGTWPVPLEVIVANTLRNRMVGDGLAGDPNFITSRLFYVSKSPRISRRSRLYPWIRRARVQHVQREVHDIDALSYQGI